MALRGSRTLLIHRSQPVDMLDDPSEVAENVHEERNCVVVPSRTFSDERGWVNTEILNAFLPHTADVEADDEVEIVGQPYEGRYEIQGVPAYYENKRGVGKAWGIDLKKVG